GGARVGDQVPRASLPRLVARVHAPSLGATAPRGLAVRQGQRRVDPREVQELRARRADRVVRRAVPHAQGARGGARRPDQVRGEAPGAAGRGRPDLEPASRAAADVQRLLGRRRRDRAPRVREFRRPGGLRAARAARRIGEGRDRDRALLRLVARHQAQGRGRARRRGLPHLLGPERGRLHPRRHLSPGPVATARRRAARQCDGHARLSRRSTHPGRRCHQGREASAHRSGADDHEDPGASDFLRRRPALACGARRPCGARGVARRPRDQLPRRPRTSGRRTRPTRISAAWDGEAPALAASTEWDEAHADQLSRKAIAYLNTDTNGRGYLFMGGSHSPERFINDVARHIEDPETKLTVWKRGQLRAIADASSADGRQEARQRADLRIGALGSGSDYTPFLQHVGVASLNLGFGGEDGGGIYHSIYDDFKWYTTFDDTAFVYGRALAQTVGTAVMRLADAEVLPYEFTGLAETVGRYVKEVEKLLKDKQDEVRERNRQLDEGVFAATADPRERFVPPAREEIPPFLNFAPLDNTLDVLTRAAD